MIKTILVSLLGLFFIINGFNHFYNENILKEYAHKKGLISPQLMVKLSGVCLILGGISLITQTLLIWGVAGLCLFLLIASFSIHQFWRESDKQMMMLEFSHFVKNWAIMFELVYIVKTLAF